MLIALDLGGDTVYKIWPRRRRIIHLSIAKYQQVVQANFMTGLLVNRTFWFCGFPANKSPNSFTSFHHNHTHTHTHKWKKIESN